MHTKKEEDIHQLKPMALQLAVKARQRAAQSYRQNTMMTDRHTDRDSGTVFLTLATTTSLLLTVNISTPPSIHPHVSPTRLPFRPIAPLTFLFWEDERKAINLIREQVFLWLVPSPKQKNWYILHTLRQSISHLCNTFQISILKNSSETSL